MIHYVVAFAVLLHVGLWGAGAAMLAMPHAWRRLWPVLIMPAGIALQSAIVWAGAHAGFRGTNAYAWWAELIPLTLLAVALRQHGWRKAATDVSRFGLVWAAMAGCLALLVLPVAIASRGLTTISLGSCDAADYAAGARVLMEFASTDRGGFLGLTEVVRVHSVDNFFDYWIRLNHFTPSALMAFNGTILDCSPHELATLVTAVLLAATVPLAFWSARAVIGYNGIVSLLVAVVFGINPVMWYAVAHVSPGQLVAAQAVVLLTWSGVALWRGRLTWVRALHFSGVLLIGYWLVAGAYNFFLLLCLVPAVAYAGGLAIWQGAWLRLVQWTSAMLAPLLGCLVLFAGRFEGLKERFALLEEYDFGWQIPALSAEGWLGMVQGPDLAAWSVLGFSLRWVLSAAAVGLFMWAFLRAVQQRRRAAWLVTAIVVPVLGGYFWLQSRGDQPGTNESYDAYKLLAVFYPLLLPALFWWVTLRRSRRLHEWLLVAWVAAVVGAFNLAACGMFIWKMSRPPLIVDGDLRQLRKIEAMADVGSINLLVPDMWSRLWANAFLLRKPQYFLTHTYEGRLNTPLRGDWDLEGGTVAVHLPGDARREVSPRFALVDTRHPAFVRVELGEGWHAEEFAPGTPERWRWTTGAATLRLENPHDYPLVLACSLDGWSPSPNAATWQLANGPATASVTLDEQRAERKFAPFEVPPWHSTLQLRLERPPVTVPGDPRPLGVSVFRLHVTPRRE